MDYKKNISKHRLIISQIIKFNIVGVINTLITYGIYSALVFIGLRDVIALCLEYMVGIVISFFLNHKYTFGLEKYTFVMFLKMVLTYVPSLFLNFWLLLFFTLKLGYNSYIAQIFSLIIVTGLTFILQKKYVFRLKEEK